LDFFHSGVSKTNTQLRELFGLGEFPVSGEMYAHNMAGTHSCESDNVSYSHCHSHIWKNYSHPTGRTKKMQIFSALWEYLKIATKWDEKSNENGFKSLVQGFNGNRMENVLWKYIDEGIHYSEHFLTFL